MEPVTTINVAAMLILLGGLIAKIVQRIRVRFPRIDGDLVTLLAVLIGAGLAWSLDLRGAATLAGSAGLDLGTLPEWVDYAITGLGLGLGAGVISDIITKAPPTLIVPDIGELPEDELGAH